METVIRRARIEINFETQYGSYLSSYQSLKLRQNNIYATPYHDKESRLSQGGITCGAIDEPRKSLKAIDERVIIRFRDKNVVIARFRDKNVYR